MIPVLHLFPKLNSSLIYLLEGLSPAQWNNSTVCRNWLVKDITAHLLDTAIRKVSSGRDRHLGKASELNSQEGLMIHLNELNADWVRAYDRVSPQILIRQLFCAQDEHYKYLITLDLTAPALFPVSWAGEDKSLNWFDIAREYTERWHHQQQIRLAVGANSILERELYHPFLQICMLALPFHYRLKVAADRSVIRIHVVGEAGGSWTIVRVDDSWRFSDTDVNAHAEVYIDQNVAWMLLSKGIDIFEAEHYWQVLGDYELGFHALKMTSFMV